MSRFNSPLLLVAERLQERIEVPTRGGDFGLVDGGLPHQALRAGEFGYIRSENCFSDHMEPLPDIRKWPRQPVMNVPAHATFGGHELPPVIHGAGDAIEALKEERAAWIESLEADGR